DLTSIYAPGVDDVVAAEPVDGERVAGVHAAHDCLRRQSVDEDRRAAAHEADRVLARCPVDDDVVRLTVAAAARRGEVDRDQIDASSSQITDRDIVRAAKRRELDMLDAVEI